MAPTRLETPVVKVLTYVTWQARLLVFRQPRFPELGIQVPGGSVESGEQLELAALREAREETGLTELTVARYLGSARYELKVDQGPPHLRHFFELTCGNSARERWLHVENGPSSRGAPNHFELWWEPLTTVRLDWEMDAYLAFLR